MFSDAELAWKQSEEWTAEQEQKALEAVEKLRKGGETASEVENQPGNHPGNGENPVARKPGGDTD